MQIDIKDERSLVEREFECFVIEPMHMFYLKIVIMVMDICICFLSFVQLSMHFTTIMYTCVYIVKLCFVIHDILKFEQYMSNVDTLTVRSRWIMYSCTIPFIQDLVIYSIHTIDDWVRICIGIVTIIGFSSSMQVEVYIRMQSTRPAICWLVCTWLSIFSLIVFFIWYTKGVTNMLNIIMNMCITWMYLLFGVTTSSHFAWICSKDTQISRRVDCAYNVLYSITMGIVGLCLFFYYQSIDLLGHK